MSSAQASAAMSGTALMAAPAHMSLIAVRTGAGAGGRSGRAGWPADGRGWCMVTSSR